VGTVSLIKKCIDQFRLLSSLSSNHDKSSMFLCGVKHVFKTPLLEVHKERNLPVRYLGVPFITTKLTSSDCLIHVDYKDVGKLQLIKSIIF